MSTMPVATSLAARPHTDRLGALDAVRAFATLAVFLFHAGYVLTFADSSVYALTTARGLINWHHFVYTLGTVGVSVFFVLSGFLLFYQLCKNDEPLTRERLWVYTKKRLLRILPLYYFSLLFIVLVLRPEILSAPGGIKSVLFNLVFLRGLKNGAGEGGTITINPVYWSLVVEMHFYILLPIFYSLFYRFKKSLWWFTLPIFFGFLYRVALVYFVHTPTMQMMRFTPANFDYFALGMGAAYVYTHYQKSLKVIRDGVVQAFLVAGFFVFIYLYPLDFVPSLAYVWAPLLLGAFVSAAILSLLVHKGTFVRFITTAPVRFVALISYSMYIWHTLVIGYFDPLPLPGIVKFGLVLVCTLVASTVTYYCVEAPFLKPKTS